MISTAPFASLTAGGDDAESESFLTLFRIVNCQTFWYTISMRMGRPPKPPSEVRSLVIPLRLTRAEWRELQKRAKENGLPVSEYIRTKLNLQKEK
jgi:hypothetical protein